MYSFTSQQDLPKKALTNLEFAQLQEEDIEISQLLESLDDIQKEILQASVLKPSF